MYRYRSISGSGQVVQGNSKLQSRHYCADFCMKRKPARTAQQKYEGRNWDDLLKKQHWSLGWS